ncbi:hypothetical protein [Chryseobacterium culicis]|uniref:YD repeat-containing protein n=1 Tax=Chryseobacterium culicis TaxID=680127 RepID=A0A1H6HD07_CHRCI|nr:hypothetical protein [Chryseobacterium culicis]SEH31843.1 hypothetical protein SAMN05421593_1584 [Chryseobacterium culicis]
MRNVIISGFILNLLVTLKAQNTSTDPVNTVDKTISNIIPPTPESFKFGTFGNIATGLFTGGTNIDIPITEFHGGSIKIPININYASNGIRVDELNGSVGLGWRFINAGVITRIIRDLPDEVNSTSTDTPNIDLLGYNDPTVVSYLKNCKKDNFDSELDIYTANFCGTSLSFYIERNGNIRLLNNNGYKITKQSDGFTITGTDGSVYSFFDNEKTRTTQTNSGMHREIYVNTTAWYLTKIVDTNNHQVNIEYYDQNFQSTIAQSQTMIYTKTAQQKYSNPSNDPNSVACSTYCNVNNYIITPDIGLISETNQITFGKQIKKIYDETSEINFEYEAQQDDFGLLKRVAKYHNNEIIEDFNLIYKKNAKNRIFLSSLNNIKNNSKYSFDYYSYESVPARLSFSRDKWGYFNDQSNSSLIPQIFTSAQSNLPQYINYSGANQEINTSTNYYGLLQKITYPTGGNTTLFYETPKIDTQYFVPESAYNNSEVMFTSTDDHTSVKTKSITIIPGASGYAHITAANDVKLDGGCYNSNLTTTQKQNTSVTVFDQTNTPQIIYKQSLTYGMVETGTGVTCLTGTSDDGYVYLQKDQPYKFELRAGWFCSIANATIFYPAGETPAHMETINKPVGGLRVSKTIDTSNSGDEITKLYKYNKLDGTPSIKVNRDPVFSEINNTISYCEGSQCSGPVLPIQYYSITSSNLNQYGSFEPDVCYDTVIEDLGQKGKIVHKFITDNDETGSINGSEILSAPRSNTAWNNGIEYLTQYYKDDTKVKEIEKIYFESPFSKFETFSLATRKKYELLIAFGGVGEFDNLDLVLYKNISRFTYLQSQKTTDYFNGTPVLTQTDYFYNNPSHYQLNKQKTTFPDGTINETNYQYAHEKGNQKLINANMIGIPLETEVKKNLNTVSKTETKYDNPLNLLPSSVVSTDLQNTQTTEITYDQYDSKGNLQQYTTKDGISTTIIWGYNQTQPIAKIENVKIAAIQQPIIDALVNASNTDAAAGSNNDETNLLTAFNNFKNTLPGYQITTYSYDPLIGVRSITPPSGIRENYIYDSAGRLQKIVDVNGQIIKEMKYNYKQ